MRRPFAVLALIVTLVVASSISLIESGRVAAQAATPRGRAIPVVDADGASTGTVAVADVADPFSGFDPSQPPEAGKHYVALQAVYDAKEGKRLDVDPAAIVLQGASGDLWQPAYLPLPESSPMPQLTGQSLGPGSRITGLIGYVVPDGAPLARVWYRPDSDHLFPLANLAAPAPPAVGQPVVVADANGHQGTVTVASVDDPFEGFDPSSPPEAGSRFVLLTLVYENTGSYRFDVEPYGLTIRDAHGRLWQSVSVNRPSDQVVVPDLSSRQLAPGDRISGAVGFAVPEAVALDGLYWQPDSNRLIELASFAAAAATPTAPTPPATPIAGPGGSNATPASADACAGMAAWLDATRNRIQQAAAMSLEDATLSDPAALAAHQRAYADLAAAQLAQTVPPGAQAVNHALVATLQAYSQSVETLAAEPTPGAGPNADTTDAIDTFNAAGQRLTAVERQLPTVAGACGLS
jgi:uncharacterized protein DUF4352